MIKNGMFVRCAIDDEKFSRDYAIGKIKEIDEFSELVDIIFFDVNGVGKFYPKPKNKKYNVNKISHIKIRIGAIVKYKKTRYIVKALKLNKENGMYYYYIQSDEDLIEYVSESMLECSYNDGCVCPLEQLKNYEFQNPMWFFGRSIVSRTMHIINNSLYGFSEVAGCKIYLKTHQLRTIIRCLQDGICRNMIADEVGMGKTIEASAVLKVYLKDNHNSNIIIIVPDSLVEQWRIELAYKFKIFEGLDVNGNKICLISMNKFNEYFLEGHYDFLIADEVHKYLQDNEKYKLLLELSKKTDNILMLSATPIQRRKDEYKKLLQLIQPMKYTRISDEKFEFLMNLQGDIVRRVHDALENFDSYLEEIDESENEHSEDTKDAFEDIIDSLEKIQKLINDNIFKDLYENINYESEDFGIEKIQGALAYVCENYQFEKSIIRNRRGCEKEEDYNIREIKEISYDMQTNFNNTEYNVYRELASWIENKNLDYSTYLIKYKRLVSAFFSSAVAFDTILNNGFIDDAPEELFELSTNWKNEEKENILKMHTFMEDPEGYESRMNNIIDYIDQELYGKKVLVFTNFDESFLLYKDVFERYFGKEHCAFFSKYMESDERELGAYRFETDSNYWILLSDESGGEGRNFQNADVVVHIDIPWNANEIEQRIGRLDRIGREKNKPVISVVCYAKLSIEEDLFKFWNEGIGIFTKSQSGLEIIMNDMDEKIIKAVCNDFKYGLIGIINEVKKEIGELKQIITRERYFDVAEYKYQAINKIMDNTREMYVSNEKQLFADSMMRWSALSGFHGKSEEKSIIRFDENSFSLKSAYNSLFVPPDINLVINNKINQLQNKMRCMNDEKISKYDLNYVEGTFDRKIGIDNDYIHFFAPGDAIFDSIVNNALGSYKGTCAAFACKANIDWTGFVFTWALYPNETLLLEKGLSLHTIDKYRGFMQIEQLQCAISISNNDNVSEEEVINTFNYLMTSENVDRKKFKHLGSRSGLHPNINSFINMYPQEKWIQEVEYGYQRALEKVKVKINKKLKKQLSLLKVELLKNSGAQKAIGKFYLTGEKVVNEDVNDLLLQCFSTPRMILDSVCYVRMIDGL